MGQERNSGILHGEKWPREGHRQIFGDYGGEVAQIEMIKADGMGWGGDNEVA